MPSNHTVDKRSVTVETERDGNVVVTIRHGGHADAVRVLVPEHGTMPTVEYIHYPVEHFASTNRH